ncbi:TVP38/TMEM64 family protein [Arthrobacter roseus]|uniref:TVP38/TMEM64 family protein n=1 Tax=Arthrobacter roseus TaxID=136274 RepID=UPI001965127A|nr:TVP38/TMEM64 family protein [Arthrobacter roseus]MBM7846823.1 putative membrane protein YdjX (TVP38/TMEM64 family) [Arthrobacter roseus]
MAGQISVSHPVRRLILLLLFVAAAAVVVLLVPIPEVEQLRGMTERAGWWAPAAFVLGYAALTLAPVPKNVLSIGAGVLFGFSAALAVVYIGAMLGAAAAFWLGRVLGRDAVEKLTGTRVEKVDEVLRRRGFVAVIGVRLVPVLPFTAINYSAGLTSLGWRSYMLGTGLGILPGAISFVALGAFGLDFGWQTSLAAGVLGALTLVGLIYAVRRRRGEKTHDV